MHQELLDLDGIDAAHVDRMVELQAIVDESELGLVSAVDAAREVLGRRHGAVTQLIGALDIGVVIAVKPLNDFRDFAGVLTATAAGKSAAAAAKRLPPVLGSGIVQSERLKKKLEGEAKILDLAAADYSKTAADVDAAVNSVELARAQLVGEEADSAETEAADTEGGTKKPKGGPCTAELQMAMASKNCYVQRYWGNTLVGGDCESFTDNHEEIMMQVRLKIHEIFPDGDVATQFYDRHVAVLAPLLVVSRLSRAVAMLSDQQIEGELGPACIALPKALRASYPDHDILTIKGHLVEDHYMDFARHYGTLGVFAEDGMEAYHPMDSRFRLLVRTMRNAVQRHKAFMGHMTIQQSCGKKRPKAHVRRSKAQIDLAREAHFEMAVATPENSPAAAVDAVPMNAAVE